MIYALPARNMITSYVSEVPLMDINVIFNWPVNTGKVFVRLYVAQLGLIMCRLLVGYDLRLFITVYWWTIDWGDVICLLLGGYYTQNNCHYLYLIRCQWLIILTMGKRFCFDTILITTCPYLIRCEMNGYCFILSYQTFVHTISFSWLTFNMEVVSSLNRLHFNFWIRKQGVQ